MAHWIKADGRVIVIQPLDNVRFTLAELQRLVGGYIEVACRLGPNRVMWCNEEGKLHGLPYNPLATELAQVMGGLSDTIVGDALVATLAETGDDDNEEN